MSAAISLAAASAVSFAERRLGQLVARLGDENGHLVGRRLRLLALVLLLGDARLEGREQLAEALDLARGVGGVDGVQPRRAEPLGVDAVDDVTARRGTQRLQGRSLLIA